MSIAAVRRTGNHAHQSMQVPISPSLEVRMNYWWASQGKTFHRESSRGYLWAPGAASSDLYHWKSLDLVHSGDVIFCYVRQEIRAVAVARSTAEAEPRPDDYLEEEAWEGPGRRILADYSVLRTPVPLSSLDSALKHRLNVKYGPLDSRLKGKQGYLFHVPDDVGVLLMHLLDRAQG
jgi:hypothetical protein